MVEKEKLPPKEHFSEWFHKLVNRTLIDQRYPLQGFLVYRPLGYQLFRNCLNILEKLLVETGHKECYFPLLIPEPLLQKEETHIAGFRDEVFWVTHGGTTPMGEKAALRPTSETAMYTMLSLWISSWRDLPFKIYQSCSVFRYETKHTRPLIRDREILWNEAHTSHATAEEAAAQIKVGIEIYRKLFERLAIPVIFIRAVEGVFAGAEYAIEPYTVFPDGRALEMGSVNNLGQKFSKAFGVKFKTADDKEDYVYQTCYGVSERLVAAIVAIHGDERGNVFPPEVAPIQLMIVPIIYGGTKEKVMKKAMKIKEDLKQKFRIELDNRENVTPGVKFYEEEMEGVPLRLEIGKKEVEDNCVTIVRRDTGERYFVEERDLVTNLEKLFKEIHQEILKRAKEHLSKKIKEATDVVGLRKLLDQKNVVRVLWCGNLECASELEKSVDTPFIGAEYDVTAEGKCINCKKDARYFGIIGKMY